MESDFQISSEMDAGEENLHHIINISLACDNRLWYDFKNFELISQTSFSYLLRAGKIEKYIDDPNHPIIGDPDEYNRLCETLKTQINRLRKCMKIFDDFLVEVESFSHVYGDEEFSKTKSDGLAKVCFSSDPLVFLSMISIDKEFKTKVSDKEIWIKVWQMMFPKISYEPFEDNLMMTYLRIRAYKKCRVLKELGSSVKFNFEKIKGIFALIEGDEIIFVNENKKFRIIQGVFVEGGKKSGSLLRGLVDNNYFRN
jgi:hypothetical protein